MTSASFIYNFQPVNFLLTRKNFQKKYTQYKVLNY